MEKREKRLDTDANKTFSSGRFHDLGLAETLADHLHGRMGFTAPTHIQREAIPVILSGKDVLVNAGTGTGKTLVYLAPIINALQGQRKPVSRSDGTHDLMKEQIHRYRVLYVFTVAEQLVHRFIWLVPGCLMGGENRAKEKARLRKGITLLVATPGRLLDHLNNTASFKLDKLRWLVFDEADRLLDLGFDKDIQNILALLGSRQSAKEGSNGANQQNYQRQHMLLSATLDKRVNQLADLSLRDPVIVGLTKDLAAGAEVKGPRDVTTEEGGEGQEEFEDEEDEGRENKEEGDDSCNKHTKYNIPSQMNQYYYKVPCKLRLAALLGLLRQRSSSKTSGKLVIFFSTCDAVDFHFSLISTFQLPSLGRNSGAQPFMETKVFKLHGNMPQKERTETYVQFGQASNAFLVCTDVASRGLDFKGVTCIVQYDPPGDSAEYVHRVGRTARLGQEGEAILILQPCEMDYLNELKKHGVMLKELSLQQLMDVLPSDRKGNRKSQDSTVEMHPAAGYMHMSLETFVSKNKELNAMALKAFYSYVRAYAAHKAELKPIFQVHKLHLGHVAKSFGLKSAPTLIGKLGSNASKKEKVEKKDKLRARSVQGNFKKRRLHAATMEE